MEGFLGNLGKTVERTMNSVGKKTDEFIEVQKLNNKVSTLQRQYQKYLTDVGEIMLQRYQDGAVHDEELRPLFEQLLQVRREIDRYQDEIADKKGQELCAACGMYAPKGSAFCPSCGAAMSGGQNYNG